MMLPTTQDIMESARTTGLSASFEHNLKPLIDAGAFRSLEEIARDTQSLVERLARHREVIGRNVVAIGMSGGLDSALTAALFQAADWDVRPVLLPIHQNKDENDRGRMVCEAFGLQGKMLDLSDEYSALLARLVISNGFSEDKHKMRVRQGNVRARLRMVALYDLAQAYDGIVASTDNLSELTAGFWTLHGDVGDIAPIQSYNKSWDIPMMAAYMNVPMEVIQATPTDGLNVAGTDEEQLGCSYLEWDIVMHSILRDIVIFERIKASPRSKVKLNKKFDLMPLKQRLKAKASDEDSQKIERIFKRIQANSFKQVNPHNYDRQGFGTESVLGTVQDLAQAAYPAADI